MSTIVENWEPSCRDCPCCSGFRSKCDCCRISGHPVCIVCESIYIPQSQTDFRITNAKYDWCVKIYPPPSSNIHVDLFKIMFLPQITIALGTGMNNEQITWIDRGWKSGEDYNEEMNCSLHRLSCREEGIVIARAQTCDEASFLVKKLESYQLQAQAFQEDPQLTVTTIGPPPERIHILLTEELPSFTTLNDLGSSYSPSNQCHHVILYLPNDAPNYGNSLTILTLVLLFFLILSYRNIRPTFICRRVVQ